VNVDRLGRKAEQGGEEGMRIRGELPSGVLCEELDGHRRRN